jgi:radical SAM protein with 4Fe4S-binding SPASM domain
MAGCGFCFVSHIGEVGGCGYLPLLAGNVRQASLVTIYRESPLFASLRDADLLQGRCGICEYRALCGGCRARALGASENYLEEEPFCTYQPDPGKARDLLNVEAVLAQAVPHEGRDEVMPPRDRIPPLF